MTFNALPTAMVHGNMPAENGLMTSLLGAGDIAYHWDFSSGQIVWTGDDGQLIGHPLTSVANHISRLMHFFNPEDSPARLRALHLATRQNERFDCEYRLRHESGYFVWIHDRGKAMCDSLGNPTGIAGVIRQIPDRQRFDPRSERLNEFDELTGLFNRRHLREILHDVMVQGFRYGFSAGFLTIGVDHLAKINEGYGFAAADAVLVQIARRLHGIIDRRDHVGRLGGDVFGMVLPRHNKGEMAVTAERILSAIRDQSFETPIGRIDVTCSVGGIVCTDFGHSPDDIMTMAETALHEAKRAGRNTYRPYRLTDQERQAHRMDLSVGDQVKNGLRNHRFTLAFQPIVRASTGDVAFYESLLRLNDEHHGIIPAGHFVPAAERLGLVRSLDRHGLDLMVETMDQHAGVQLSINVSPVTILERSWARSLITALQDRQHIARRLIVEITESSVMEDLDEAARFISAMHELGIKVALDDFGAGYTSFAQLRTLDIDMVKIDGSYIKDLRRSKEAQLFIRTLLDLAHGLELETVAEFVELESDAAFLTEAGVTYLQGHMFGKATTTPGWLADKLAEPEEARQHDGYAPLMIF